MDCNTLLDIFGTFKISTKSGPSDLLFITIIFQKIKEMHGMCVTNMFVNLKISEIHFVTMLEKTGAENDEDPRNKDLRILDAG